MNKNKITYFLIFLLIFTGVLSLGFGSSGFFLPLGDLTETQWDILAEIRMPRFLAALLIGITLPLSGLILQAILGNPLADPYLIGVSSGASFGYQVYFLFLFFMGFSPLSMNPFGASLSGALGSLLVAIFIYRLAFHSKISTGTNSLLLIGIILSLFLSAMVSLMISIGPTEYRSLSFLWLIGYLGLAKIEFTLPFILITFFLSILLFKRAKGLDLLQMGSEFASTTGLDPKKENKFFFILASLLTSFAVVSAGSIGFVGLVIPHMARQLYGSHHRILVLICPLLGSIFIFLADLISRAFPLTSEIPIGAICALFGAPYFIFALLKQGNWAWKV